MFRQRPKSYEYLGFDDRLIRLIGIPMFSFIIPTLLFNYNFLTNPFSIYLVKWSISFTHTLLYWEGARILVIQLRKRFPGFSETRRRVIWEALLVPAFAALVAWYMFNYGCCQINYIFGHDMKPPQNNIITILLVMVWAAIYEGVYLYYQLKNSLLEKEQAKQAHIRSQLEGLRNQVNPHFLFNSLNTLMNIVTEDQQLAIRFLKKLSKVYRYLLETREDTTISLEEELGFIESYVFLQQERFKGNLHVEIDIPTTYTKRKIVPLSMQMLFENAIKHNVISNRKPLTIKVYINEKEHLVVENNLQLKNQVMHSTKVGLENIRSRYRLMTDTRMEIRETESCFTVELPLI